MKLRFYKKGIPVKIIRKLVLLGLVFVFSVVFFEMYTNQTETIQVSNMSDPTLPTIDLTYLNAGTTKLHGYITEMDPCYMRDAIIPLDKERTIDLLVHCEDYDVEGLSYEIRSLDTQRKIASNDIPFSRSHTLIEANIQAENLIETGEEYLLVITVSNSEQDVYYYTRIMQTDSCHESEIVDFALNFHEVALSDNADSLSTYIEPSSYESNDSLYNVNIKSSLSQINYGTFDGSQVGDTYVTLTDISTNYVTLTLTYQLESNESGSTDFYNCQEDFRVRYTPDRFYLLAYNRTMEQQLDASSITFTDNLVNIGITDEDVQYLSNETGTIVAFVHSGSLFEYNQTDRSLKQIFSFLGSDSTDCRATYNQHGIKLLNIDESGTMDYVVYGYMNAGSHEGQCGINLYHYDAINDISTEQVFISSSNSYQIINANFSDLLYETADNQFYILVNGTLLHMTLNELSTEELMVGLDDSQYAVSNSGRYIAWIESPLIAESIHILDLETGSSYDISSQSGQLLRPLAFIDDDLVYGTIYSQNIITDGAGTTIYPMYSVTISDISGSSEQQLMNYNKPGYYVTDVSMEGYTIYLSRITIDSDGNILEASSDTIKNSAGAQNQAVPITTDIDPVKEKVVYLNMTPLKDNEKLGRIKQDIPGIVLADSNNIVTVATSAASTQYFVYVGSNVILATDDLISAITTADENMGIVLDNTPEYVWKRGRKSYQNAFTGLAVGSNDNEASGSAQALSAMLVHEGENVQVHTLLESGETPISILARTLKDYNILDLTGCTLSQVLYYVSVGNPVYAKTGDDTAVLLCGYDASTVLYYDPLIGEIQRMDLTEAQDYFAQFGSVYVSYIK